MGDIFLVLSQHTRSMLSAYKVTKRKHTVIGYSCTKAGFSENPNEKAKRHTRYQLPEREKCNKLCYMVKAAHTRKHVSDKPESWFLAGHCERQGQGHPQPWQYTSLRRSNAILRVRAKSVACNQQPAVNLPPISAIPLTERTNTLK